MESKNCNDCGGLKPLDKYSPSPTNKDGRIGKCRPCQAAYQKRRSTAQKLGIMGRVKEISEENKNFFRLGVLKGEDSCRDLKKALAIQERANRALLQVLVEADARDAKRPEIIA